MNLMEQIRSRVLQLCSERKIQPEALARLSGIDPVYFREFIKGTAQDIRLNDLFRLSYALDLDLSDFFDSELFDN